MNTSLNRSEIISVSKQSFIFTSLVWIAACREINNNTEGSRLLVPHLTLYYIPWLSESFQFPEHRGTGRHCLPSAIICAKLLCLCSVLSLPFFFVLPPPHLFGSGLGYGHTQGDAVSDCSSYESNVSFSSPQLLSRAKYCTAACLPSELWL